VCVCESAFVRVIHAQRIVGLNERSLLRGDYYRQKRVDI